MGELNSAQKHPATATSKSWATGKYRFVTEFYSLTIMSTEFERKMKITVAGITNTFSSIDDIPVVTHGDKQKQSIKVKEVLNRLDDPDMGLKLETCNFAMENIESVR